MSQDGDEGSEANMSTKADIGDTTDEEEDVELLELDEDEGEVDEMTTNPDASMASSAGDKGSKSGKTGDDEYDEEEGEDFSVLSDITANSDIPVDDEFKQAELEAKRKAQEEAHLRRSKWALDIEEAPPEDNEDEEDEEGPEDKVEQEGDSKGSKRKRKAINASSKTTAETKKKKQQSEKVEEVWVEPTYDSADFVSGPILSPGSDMYTGTLHMYQSYGYDCLRPYNLHVLDDDTLAFITGNYVQFYSIAEKQVTALRRSASGYGVGHIAIHPNKKYYGVAEKGDWPYIMIYTWPQQRVYRVLRKGTTRSYSYINFSPDGELLCSQGMDPDYLLTIWRWERERIVLHVKAFSQDIYRATFSTTHPGYVTTCGLGHIRFWKMAQTFTGLKLQGAIGRFGKTEISDITGFAGLPDGKIVSGSEWGNMLVWDGGLIVVEVMSKNGKNCHDGEITDLVLLETGELVTIGLDGCLRTWESEVIDLADTVVDDSGKHELEALNEYKLSTVAQPISMVRRITGAEDEATWFVQDGWGKVWSVNLHMINKEDYTPGVIFLCPGGAVRAVAASPSYSIFVIGTSTGHLWVFEYLTKWVLAKLKYNVAVTKLLWLPTHLDPKGLSFLAAFADGHVRLFYVHRIREPEVREDHSDTEDEELPYEYSLLQILRFHKGAITVMLLDDTDVLYTCGEDRLIFASKLELNPETNRAKLTPLSFVTAPFPVISLDLHPIKDYRLIIASKNGRVAECRKPIWADLGTETSYNGGKLHGRRWQYTSVKSKRRKDERREARKLELEQKLVELRNDIAERRAKGAFVEEEIEINRVVDKFRRDQLIDDEEDLYIPEKPCPVYHAYYGINKNLNRDSLSRNFFLHAGGYDAGYVYECKCSRPDAGGFHPVPPTPNFSDDVAVRCFTCSPDDEYLIFGMEDGSIRVMPRTNAEKKRLEKLATQSQLADQLIAETEDQQSDLFQQEEDTGKQQKKKKKVLPPFPESVFPYDLVNFVCVPMHDPDRGSVNDFAWSYDGKFLFSVGEDGGIFSYRWDPMGVLHGTDMDEGNPMDPPEEPPIPTSELVQDTQDPNALTLEELKIKAEKDRLWQLAESKKEVIRKKIRDLKSRFRYLLQKNNEIPEEARIPRSRFEVEPEVRKPKKLRLMKGVEEVYRRYEWQSAKSIIAIEKIENYFFKDIQTFHMVVKDISHDTQTHTFRHRILTSEFHELLKRTEDSLVQEDIQQKAELDLPSESYLTKPVAVTRVQARELIGEWESKKYDMKTMHQIRQLEDRLEKRYQRELKWADLNARKIPDDYEDRADVIAIMQAKENLGDYKLKSSEDYTGEKVTAALRRKRVIDMKLKMHEQMKAFNRCVLELRQEKYDILKQCRDIEKELKTIQRKLPPDLQKPIPKIYDMEPCEEPEKDFEITKEAIDARINKKIEELGLTQRRERQKEIENEDSELQSAVRKKKDKKSKINKQTARPATMLPPTRAKGAAGEKESPSTLKYRKAFFKPKTGLANVRLEVALQFRCFQQDMLLKKLSKLIGYFHDRVEKIRDERVALQVDILLMSVRRLQLIQELDIVKEFDTSERAVLERFNAQKVETQEAKNRLDRVQRRLSKVKQDLVKMEQAIQDVSKEVAVVVGEKQKFSDFLWKVYKKKIRVDVPGGEEEGSEMAFARHMSSSSSSTGESSDSTSQDSGSDLFKLPKQKLNPNVCPDQLDKSLYEKVCELRAKRTQMEIEAEAQKRVVEKVGKDFVIVENVYNKFTGRLEGIGEEVLILQRKRQAKMNALPSVVVLKADQIQCLDEDDFDEFSGSIVQRMKHHFPDVKDVVLFPKDGIGKLDLRIEELKDETKAERAKHKRARHMMVRLKEELLKLEQEVNQVNYRCRREMMAKFGKVVDLDDVCAAIINLEILDELTRLENRRNWHYRERKKIADEIEKARDRLTFLTKENSENNTLLAILIERQRDVEYFLFQQQQKEVDRQELLAEKDSSELLSPEEEFDMELISNEDALEELFNLEDILTRQESRIMILREAIAACKFKSGLPPLIPLRSVKDDIATSYMTMNELYALRARKNVDVETIYMGKDAEKIGESHSTFPSFISPQESGRAGWGEPHQHDVQQHPESKHESTFVAQRSDNDEEEEEEGMNDDAEAFTDETDVEEEEKVKGGDNDGDEEGEEGELFNTEYKPPNDEKLGGEEEDEDKEGPSYPLNVIPDDQMPGEEEDEEVIVEEYEEDPIPVEQAPPSDEEEEGTDKV